MVLGWDEWDQFIGFNPRPPLLAGEWTQLARSGRRATSFNPRPPLLAGE